MKKTWAICASMLFLATSVFALSAQQDFGPPLIRTLDGNKGAITALAVSRDGKILISGGGTLADGPRDRTIKAWNPSTGEEIASFDGQSGESAGVRSVAFNRNAPHFASAGDDRRVSIWDVATFKQIQSFDGNDGIIWSVAYSPNGKSLAFSSTVASPDIKTGRPVPFGAVKIWDIATKSVVATLNHGSRGSLQAVAFSPKGNLLASAGPDAFINLWDLSKNEIVKVLGPHELRVYAIAFSPDGSMIASGSSAPAPGSKASIEGPDKYSVALMAQGKKKGIPIDRSVKLWDIKTGECVASLEGHSGNVFSVAFSPDGKTLASCGLDMTARLWDVKERKSIGVITGHTGSVNALAFAPNGQWLATGSSDKTIKIWQLK